MSRDRVVVLSSIRYYAVDIKKDRVSQPSGWTPYLYEIALLYQRLLSYNSELDCSLNLAVKLCNSLELTKSLN